MLSHDPLVERRDGHNEGNEKTLGIDKVAEEIGAKLYAFDRNGEFFSKTVEMPDACLTEKLELATIGFEVDEIVPVTILKTSMEGGGITACVSLSLLK